MEKPNTVKIGHQFHNICFVNKLVEDSQHLFGRADDIQTISIAQYVEDQPISLPMQRNVLLHECMHLFSNYIGAEMKEAQVLGISNIMFSFLTDPQNKEVVDWIIKGE